MIWRQIRLAGAVMVIVAFFTHTLALTSLGLAIMACGVIGSVDRLERDYDRRNEELDDAGQE